MLIENKLGFYLSLFCFILIVVLNLPFPHHYPLGEVIFTRLHLPIRIAGSFHTIGIIAIILLVIGMILLVQSLEKFKIRFTLFAFFGVFIVPILFVSVYQNILATGVYAISYEKEESVCQFNMKNEETLVGDCELSFSNKSNETVTFDVEFYENPDFKDELAIESLMNVDAPYEVTLDAKESQHMSLQTEIDVSNMESHIESGEAQVVNVKIKSKGKMRNL